MNQQADERRFLVLLTSARRDGNTEMLARKALEHVDAPVEWINLLDVPVPDYVDVRHTPDRFSTPTGWELKLLEATLRGTDIVIASPLYMYSVSTSAKRYLDFWSGWGYAPGYDFTQEMGKKTLWGVSVLSEEDHSVADPLVNTLRLSAEWQKMRFAGVLLGIGNRPGEVLDDTAALERAQTFFSPSTVLA
jgi:multimeric flavodoxin WrbA